MDLVLALILFVVAVVYFVWATKDARKTKRETEAMIARSKLTATPPMPPRMRGMTGASVNTQLERAEFKEMMDHLLERELLTDDEYRGTMEVWDRLHDTVGENPTKPHADDICPECGGVFFLEDDYLCPNCRAKMNG